MQWQSHGEAYGELGFRMLHLAYVRDEVKMSGEVITQRQIQFYTGQLYYLG